MGIDHRMQNDIELQVSKITKPPDEWVRNNVPDYWTMDKDDMVEDLIYKDWQLHICIERIASLQSAMNLSMDEFNSIMNDSL